MSGDTRTVATDALATLGTVIDDKQKRDAIHLAVIPAIARNFLAPGQHVEVVDGTAIGSSPGKGSGIVDPFLLKPVAPGERFWLVLYPRTIQSLRHVWSHPAFPDEPVASAQAQSNAKAESERWLRGFIARSDCPSYEDVMMAIDDGYGMDGEFLHMGSDASGDIPSEFWDHVEVVLGRPVIGRPKYFSCSC